MVKSILLLLSCSALSAIAQTPFTFSINGSLKNVKDNAKTYVHHKWDNKTYTDSVKVKAGKFTYTGKSAEPNMYWITKTSNVNDQPNLIFFVDAGKINVTAHIDSLPFAKVSGCSAFLYPDLLLRKSG